MIKMKYLFLTAIVILSLHNSAFAADFFPVTAVDFKNALVTAASNGQNDTIHLPAATLKVADNGNNHFDYNSNENFSLTITGNSQATSVLDGTGKQLLRISATGGNNSNVVLEHLTIQNGDGSGFSSYGGAFINTDDTASSSASITINDVLFNNNIGHDGGGLTAWSRNGAITITNTTFHQNYANNDGGAFYIYSFGGAVHLDNVSSLNNGAKSTYAGGRMVCYSDCLVEHSVFDSNITTLGTFASVGGLSIASVNTDVLINDVLFSYNESADSQVGALVIEDNSADAHNIVVKNSQFIQNRAGTSIGGAYIISNAGNVQIENNEFSGNVAHSIVGGFYVSGTQPNINVFKNKIVMNKSETDFIGGFGVSSNGLVNIQNNVMARNETGPASAAGGVYISSKSGTFNIINNTIFQNKATSEGGGLYIEPIDNGTHFIIANNIISENQAASSIDIAVKSNSFSSDIKLVNNALSDFCLDNSCSITQLGCNASNNITTAPLFVDIDNGDLRLASGSAYIDAGIAIDELPDTDILNNTRNSGLAPDLGAYESSDSNTDNVANGTDPACTTTDNSSTDGTTDNTGTSSGASGGGCDLTSNQVPNSKPLFNLLVFSTVILVLALKRSLFALKK